MPTAAFPMHRIVSSCWTPISSPAKAKLLSEYTLTNARGRDRIGKRRPTRTYHGNLASGAETNRFAASFSVPLRHRSKRPLRNTGTGSGNTVRNCGPRPDIAPLIHRKFHRLSGKPPPRRAAGVRRQQTETPCQRRSAPPCPAKKILSQDGHTAERRNTVPAAVRTSRTPARKAIPRRHPDFRQKTLPIHRPGVPRSPLSPAQRRKTPHAAKGYPPFSRTFWTCRRAGTIRPSPFREKNRAFRPKRKLRRGIGSYGRRPDRSGRFSDRRKQKNRPPHLPAPADESERNRPIEIRERVSHRDSPPLANGPWGDAQAPCKKRGRGLVSVPFPVRVSEPIPVSGNRFGTKVVIRPGFSPIRSVLCSLRRQPTHRELSELLRQWRRP